MEKVLIEFFKALTQSSEYKICRNIRYSDINDAKNFYPYISSFPGIMDFIWQVVKDIDNKESKSFADIGCGYPIIPIIMDSLGFISYGIELNKSIIDIAKYPLTHSKITLKNENILELEEVPYDIIYMFQPISNPDLMLKGLIRIESLMKPGAILIFYSASDRITKYLQNKLKAENLDKLTELNIFKYTKK